MFTGPRLTRVLLVMVAAITALPFAAALMAPVSAETTHEANQAAAAYTSAPSTLAAEAALAQITLADGTLHFEIAEDGTRFVWADQPVFTGRRSAYGAPFLAQGYIYPPGTLSATTDGISTDGSPQFPEKVVGTWACYGWYAGGSGRANTGPWILATEIYQFGSEWGAVTLVSEGYVATESGRTISRAITGGTGPFTAMRGEVQSTPLGINETQGENARYAVQLDSP